MSRLKTGLGLIVLLLSNLGILDIFSNHSVAVTIDWVTVGDPGNTADFTVQADGTTGYGSVNYDYRIGKHEVTNGQYAEFLNAVAATDTNFLYWDLMESKPLGGIIRNGTSGTYTYTTKPNMANKPVNFVTFYDAARFANWLHNGQPVGSQDSSTTEDGAYTFAGFEIVSPRSAGALVFIPDEHEWHKAAFYEPGAVTHDGDEWWYFGIGIDSLPKQAVANANGDVRNPGPKIVNYFHGAGWNGQIQGNVTTVGSAGSSSYYGATDMAGNVFEWTVADPTKPDPFGVGPYIVRGGSFDNTSGHTRNHERNMGPRIGGGGHQHSFASENNGFRMASYVPPPTAFIPEPSTTCLVVVGILCGIWYRQHATLLTALLTLTLFHAISIPATADTFGSGLDEFSIEFVTVGDIGNAPDTTGDPNPDSPGSVSYSYRIGKYEISEDMIAKVDNLGGPSIQGSSRGPDKPVSLITWLEAASFVNWLNTSTGNSVAYKFNGNDFELWQAGDTGFDATNPYRNSLAKYFLPSADEWYKAAFYDPTTNTYYDYATGSNTTPENVPFGTLPNTAVYGQPFSSTPPADITQAGGLSPYGTMAQSGNIYEMEETDFDMVNDAVDSPRGARGGVWFWSALATGHLTKSFRNSINPDGKDGILGFRVAAKALIPDFNFDGSVDQDDLAVWITAYGATATGDANEDGTSDGADFLAWQQHANGNMNPLASSLASIPEPPNVVLGIIAAVSSAVFTRPQKKTVSSNHSNY